MMKIADFRVEPADYIADFDDLRFVREEVFIAEQGIPEHIEFDNTDPACHHFIARDDQHHPLGTARLTSQGKLGRMAVLAHWRNKGIGQALVLNAVEKARKLGLTEITLDAQASAVAFYEKLGFHKTGEIFQIARIPHQAMAQVISPVETTRRPPQKALAESISSAPTNSLESVQTATVELIKRARRNIVVYTLDLESELYGDRGVIEAFKQFAIGARGSNTQIIIHDVASLRNQIHPLFDLAHRLPSSFQFRAPIELEDLKYGSAFVANDTGGYLFRLFNTRYQGEWSPHAPARNRQLWEEYERIWQRCRQCTEFRALGI